MIDVLFINPTSPKSDTKVYQHLYTNKITAVEPPTFALLLVSYMRNKGLNSFIIDMQDPKWTEEAVVDYINHEGVGLVVIATGINQPSSSTQNLIATRIISSYLKNNVPKIPIALLGGHISALPEKTLAEEPCDYACYAEGFQTILELGQAIKENPIEPKLENVHGIMYYKDFFGSKIIQKNDRGENLTGFEFDNFVIEPAWDLIDMNQFSAPDFHALENLDKRKNFASIYSSFNCVFACRFCMISAPFGKPGYVKFSPKIVVDQIEKLIKQYGVYYIKIIDEMHLLDAKHVLGICDEIKKRGLENLLCMSAYARVDITEKMDMKDSSLLDKMLEAGYKWSALGIESGSKDVRDGADKKYTNEDITDVVKRIKSHGMNIIGNYMFGLWDDDMKSMQGTLDMALELQTEWANLYCTMSYPGSQLHKDAKENGMILPEDTDSNWIGYSQHSYECYPNSTKTLSNKEVLKFRDEAFKRYFSALDYQQMIKNKFGIKAYEYVKSIGDRPKLKRKILGD